jgi:hypothetical protein
MQPSPLPPTAPSVEADPFRARPAPADPEATYEDAPSRGELSREELLMRAAELGPSRRTWESIVLSPTDPILADKMQPRVRERRARFRRIVKLTLGACVAFCLVATGASLMSSGNLANAASSPAHKTAPAIAEVPVEKLEMPTRGKASRGVTAAVRSPFKAWAAKRR